MTKLDHVGIYVKALERSLTFYEKLFGFKVVNRFTSGEAEIGLLDIGGGLLELIQRPGSPVTPPGGNWSHLALHEPDFDDRVKTLEEMGVETRRVTMVNGNRLCFFQDPDGHTMELMESGFGS
jgi:lactoylglutathione lyase